MKRVVASAPGKAVIAGEYAVLQGAPAVAMAVNRRAVVSVATGAHHEHRLTTPGLAEGAWRFTAGESGDLEWRDQPPGGAAQLLAAAWHACKVTRGDALDVSIDTRGFFDPASGEKLGLGSSAAAMTALTAALGHWHSPGTDTVATASRAHREMQGGVGSGVDIATSCRGGLIEYRMSAGDGIRSLQWPAALCYRFLWSGKSADTRAKLGKLGARSFDAPRGLALLEAAGNVASLWPTATATDILKSLADYLEALREFSSVNGLDVLGAGHAALAALAEPGVTVYKPSGAGGGDIGMVIAAGEAQLAKFCSEAEAAGFMPLALELDPDGVNIDAGGNIE